MVVDCNNPENKDNPICLRPTPEQSERERRLSGGGLSNFVGNPIDNAVKDSAKKICDVQGGKYNAPSDVCNVNGVDIKGFSQLTGRDLYKDAFKKQIDTDTLGNYLFDGPFGTGKTSFAKAIALEYAQIKGVDPSEYFRTNVIEASGRNGIDFIRDTVDKFIKTQGLSGIAGARRKIIILDEADDLSQDAQRQLKTVFNDIVARKLPVSIFLMSNHPGRILPDITQSGRFSILEFGKLEDSELLKIGNDTNPTAMRKDPNIVLYSDGSVRALQDNIKNFTLGLPIRDYRVQDIEQLEKKISSEEKRLDLLKRQKQTKVRAEAENLASQYTRRELLTDLARLQGLTEEDTPIQEERVIEALKYKGLTDAQIISGLKSIQKEQEEEQRREALRREEASLPSIRSLGVNVSSLTPEGIRSMKIESTSIRFNSIQQNYYTRVRKIYEQKLSAEDQGDQDSVEVYDNQAIILTTQFTLKFPDIDFGQAQKQAIHDVYYGESP